MNEYRKEIDRIDAAMQKLFEERMEVSRKIGIYKASRGMPVFDAAREAAKIEELRGRASSEENADGIERVYRLIMEISREAQNQIPPEQQMTE